jgi:hypothetical protein
VTNVSAVSATQPLDYCSQAGGIFFAVRVKCLSVRDSVNYLFALDLFCFGLYFGFMNLVLAYDNFVESPLSGFGFE